MNSRRSLDRNRSFSASTASVSASWRMRGVTASRNCGNGRSSSGSNAAGKLARSHSLAAWNSSARVGLRTTCSSPGLRSRISSAPCSRTMAGSACAWIWSFAASSLSSSRPNLPSNNRTVLPMREGYPKEGTQRQVLASISQPARALCRDHTRVNSHPVEAAEEPPVLDLHAPVHDRLQPGGPRLGGRCLVLHPELLPEDLGADGDRLVGDGQHVLGLAEDVDDVHLLGDVLQGLVALLAEDFRVLGIHRNHAVAVLLHVLGGEIARPEPVRREADDGDGAGFAQDAAQRVDVVHGGDNSRMKSDLKTRHGGKILADALVAQGAKIAFGVPGESYLPVLDGMYDVRDRFQFVICRQEGGASYMA